MIKMNGAGMIHKWKPIISMMGINSEYYEMIAIYCQNYNQREITNVNKMLLDDHCLPISLKILSNLDLSRVVLNNDDIDDLYKTYSVSIKMSQDDIDDFGVVGLDIINSVESLLITEQSKYLNEIIMTSGGLFIKNACSQIRFDDKKIKLESRFITFNEYRQLKLKKISERN